MRHAIALVFLFGSLVFAQENVVKDKVIARVGDEVITLSEVNELYELYKPRFPNISPKELKERILNQLIENKLLLMEAKSDTTVTVSDEEVEQALENRIKILESQYGKENFEKELEKEGLTRESLKDKYRESVREELLIQKYIEKNIRPKVKITPKEIRDFFETYKDSLKEPDIVHVAHILIAVKPDTIREKEAYSRAMSLYTQLEKGASFEDLALRYSDDRETAEQGGELGYVPKVTFPPEVQNQLFSLKVGDISQPIRGDYGYHIFKIEDKKENSIRLKHILVKVHPSEKDWQAAYDKAVKISKMLKEGKDFSELAKKYSDDLQTRDLGGDLGWIPLTELDPDMKVSISGMKPGDIKIIKSEFGYHIVKLIDKKVGKTPTFEEVSPQIQSLLENQKIQYELTRLIERLKKKIHIEKKPIEG